MDSVEMVPDERIVTQSSVRTSTRLRRKPAFFTPGDYVEASTEDDMKFHAVVTDVKGFRDYAESVEFKGTSAWRLNQILRKLSLGLKIDQKFKYQWAIWNEEKQSKVYLEWERLTSMTQLKSHETAKLRIYRQRRQPVPVKKPELKESPKKAVAQAPKPAPRPSLTAELPCQSFFPQMPMMTPEMYAYMMMYFTNPWCYYPTFQ